MKYKKVVATFIFLTSILFLSGCYAQEFIDDFKFRLEKSNPTIMFTNDSYELTLDEERSIYYIFDKAGLESEYEVTLETNDPSIVSINGYKIKGLEEGNTTIRIRVKELGISSEVKVNVRKYELFVDYFKVDNSKASNDIVIEKLYNYTLIDRKGNNINNSDVTFIADEGNIIADELHISSNVIGRMSFRIIHNETQNVIYIGNIRSTLNEKVMEDNVRLILEKNSNDIITIEDLNEIKSIYLEIDKTDYENQNILTLGDLKYFPNEKEAHFAYNEITKSSLEYLVNYQYIDLRNNKLSGEINLNYPNLNRLMIDYNQTAKLNLNTPKLTYISLRQNKVDTIELNGLETLKYIIAPSNLLTNLDFLTNSNLKVIDMANNKISSLNPVISSSDLTELYIGGNPGLSQDGFLQVINDDVIKKLTHLNVGGGEDFTPATNSILNFVLKSNNLIWLQVYKLNLTSSAFINEEDFPNLRYLKISHNDISNYSTLSYIEVLVNDVNDDRQN